MSRSGRRLQDVGLLFKLFRDRMAVSLCQFILFHSSLQTRNWSPATSERAIDCRTDPVRGSTVANVDLSSRVTIGPTGYEVPEPV